MSGLDIFVVGLGLGLRHAMDADHVVVVSTLLSHERGTWRALRVAVLWGAGHTLAFLGLGTLVVATGFRVPDSFERLASLVVGASLIAVGVWHLARSFRSARRGVDRGVLVRPVLMGGLHGLAGSAGVALIAATTFGSRALAAAYLGLVALGTVLGMAALTIAMSQPLAWTARHDGVPKKIVALVAGALSIGLGAWIVSTAAIR